MRENLVFFRAGANSLHQKLISEDTQRNWDCFVNWYIPPPVESDSEFYSSDGFNKYEGFSLAWLNTLKDKGYKYFALLDDDILFKPGEISRMFSFCHQHNLDLSQPALRWGSNANYPFCLWNPFFQYRNASFVEVMMPFFSEEILKLLLPTMTLTKSTWGIDHAWASLLAGQNKMTIVDAVRAHHTKPVDRSGGAFYQLMKSNGIDPEKEYQDIKAQFPLTEKYRTLDKGHRSRSFITNKASVRIFDFSEDSKSDYIDDWHPSKENLKTELRGIFPDCNLKDRKNKRVFH